MNDLYNLATQLGQRLLSQKQILATCESCTGGWLSQAVTAIAGSSDWFDRGFVSYSYEAKTDMLGVPKHLITQYGAVSEEVAKAMAVGGLSHSKATITVAITGIAGPAGGTNDKPIGTVWFGFATNAGAIDAFEKHFKGDRENIRKQSVLFALETLLERYT